MTSSDINQPEPLAHAEVQLCITVPAHVREVVRAVAKRDNCTVRTVILRALRDAGLIEIAEDKLADQRAVNAAEKARLYREHRATRP